VGDWTLTFMRDEYADHGRPFGGREGGEGAVQPAQGARPDYGGEQRPGADRAHVDAQVDAHVDQVQGDLAKDEQAVGE